MCDCIEDEKKYTHCPACFAHVGWIEIEECPACKEPLGSEPAHAVREGADTERGELT